jgi:hypothetical protein
MSFLIFNRGHSFDFANWLDDSDEELFLYSDRPIREMHRYRGVEIFPSFDESGLTELLSLALARQRPLTRILCHSEYDLIRAAVLRQRLGLPGQSVASANAYRNKVLMKELVAKAALSVAPQVRLENPLQLLTFVEEQGFPVVVKPVDGGGSRGVEVLHDDSQLCQFLKKLPQRDYMAERFVDGQMYHIDGVTRNSEVLFASVGCCYDRGWLNFQSQRTNGAYLMEPSDPLQCRLVQFAADVIRALPMSPELGFHAEVFVTPLGEIVLCEIAARTSGNWVVEMNEAAYGVNINREWMRLAAGLSDGIHLQNLHMKRHTGYLILPPRTQGRHSVPFPAHFDWCRAYVNDVSKHLNGGGAVSSAEYASLALVEGETSVQVSERMQELDQWWRSSRQAD